MQKPLKLSDVAAAAGVSKATASNVFSAPERVRLELRLRVEAAARSLGYAGPDPKGRLLSGGKANAIGIVPPGAFGIPIAFRHPYMREFLGGVSDICEEHGAGLHIVSGIAGQKARGIRNALVDGLILSSIADAELINPALRGTLPFVVMDEDCGPDINSVRSDDRDGARQATRHLIELGHRQFAILSVLRDSGKKPIYHGPQEKSHQLIAGYPIDRERLVGVAEALTPAGISIDQVPIVEVFGGAGDDDSFGGARQGAALLLDKAPQATAILAMGDTQELAVLAEAARRNISVPRELSIVGFDDPPQLAQFDPLLTTVVQDVAEKGRIAARLLFAHGPPRQIVLPVRLAVRNSTAAPRS